MPHANKHELIPRAAAAGAPAQTAQVFLAHTGELRHLGHCPLAARSGFHGLPKAVNAGIDLRRQAKGPNIFVKHFTPAAEKVWLLSATGLCIEAHDESLERCGVIAVEPLGPFAGVPAWRAPVPITSPAKGPGFRR